MSADYLYHGSHISGIKQLEARSKLHNSSQNVVYLTDNIPYALLYIWDSNHNGYSKKYVTGWIKNGITFYEEQFPNQLKTFYQGVPGYLYYVSDNPNIKAMENRESLFYSLGNTSVINEEYIADVYEKLLEYEKEGKFKILRYTEQIQERQNELIEMIATAIIKNDFYKEDTEEKEFMKKHFNTSWERAKKLR